MILRILGDVASWGERLAGRAFCIAMIGFKSKWLANSLYDRYAVTQPTSYASPFFGLLLRHFMRVLEMNSPWQVRQTAQ